MTAEEQILLALQKSERRYNFFKIILVMFSAIAIILVVLYTSHQLYSNSEKNRLLLRCTVVAISAPEQTPDKFRTQLNSCLDETQ